MQDRLDRLQDQRIKPEDALARIESQASDEERRAGSVHHCNGGDLEALTEATAEL